MLGRKLYFTRGQGVKGFKVGVEEGGYLIRTKVISCSVLVGDPNRNTHDELRFGI